MRIVAENVTGRSLDGFNKIQDGSEVVHLKKGVLTSGASWKGRFATVLETLGVFKEYCTTFRKDEEKSNRHAAELLWRSLVTRYGVENARQGLDNLSPRFRGMDTLKARQGLITYSGVDKTARLTCGEVRTLLDGTKKLFATNPQFSPPAEAYTLKNAFDELRPLLKVALDKTQEQLDNLRANAVSKKKEDTGGVPKTSEVEKLYYAGAVKHSEEQQPAMLNHQRAKMFIAETKNMDALLSQLGVESKKLKPGRLEFISSRVFKDIRENHTKEELSRPKIVGLVKNALQEAVSHRVTWNRMQALHMGIGKVVSGEGKRFTSDVQALVKQNREVAEAAITESFVRSVALQEGYAVNDVQVRNIIKKALNVVENTVLAQRIDLEVPDYKEIVRREIVP